MTIWAVSLLRSELSPGFLTAAVRVSGIRSLVENPTVAREFSSSSSTSRPYFRDASPQAISERTSYRRTRLEFLLYTQVIPECCTARGSGPPRSVTFASPCSYVARPASGLVHAIINALIRLAFTLPPEYDSLGDHVEQTRWLVLQKARRHHHAYRFLGTSYNHFCKFLVI